MKSSDITEARLDELGWKDIPGAKTVAKVAGAVKGAATPGATMRGGWNREAYTQQIEAMASQAIPYWNQQEAALEAQGIAGAEIGDYLQNWASKYFKIQAPEAPPMVNDANAFEYLKKCVAMKMSPQMAKPAQGQQPQQPQQAQQPQQPQQAQQPQQPAAAPAATQQPQANPAHAVFQDPEKFKAEFDKYIKSTGLNQLVNFKLKDVLKGMWMRSGGTRVESKKNKGTRV